MLLPRFELHRPQSLESAERLAADLGDGAFDWLGGGTDHVRTTGESFTRPPIFLPRPRARWRLTITQAILPSVPSAIFFLA